MVQKNDENNLVTAINANNWNDIYNFATNDELSLLRQRANFFKDKVDSELFLHALFGDSDTHQEQVNCLKLRRWIDSNVERLDNKYMRSLLRSFTYESSGSEIHVQTSMFKELIGEFPERWETYMCWSFSLGGIDPNKSLQLLNKAKEINSSKEMVMLWSMILSKNNSEHIRYGNEGYAINHNSLFLFLIAKKLGISGDSTQARAYYQRIINDEPEASHIRKKAISELASLSSPQATTQMPAHVSIIGYIVLGLSALVGFAASGFVGLIWGIVVGWFLRYPVAMICGSLQTIFSKK